MMTREEAIEVLRKLPVGLMDLTNEQKWDLTEAVEIALSALHPINREQVEKVWRGCPECKQRCGLCVHMGAWDRHGKHYVCEQCVDYSNFESDQRFCEVCGRPMTDDAVQMVMERLEALYETT